MDGLIKTSPKGAIIVESNQPYRISIATEKGVRTATPREILTALHILYLIGNFGILRLLAIFVRKLTMSFRRSS